MTDKPFAPDCERNRDPILAVLREHFAGARHVLEVGSGTGQHAVQFAAAMPLLRWQCSDQAEHLPGIRAWLEEAALDNTPLPLALDVSDAAWPRASTGSGRFDAMFSDNTLHIMGWDGVEAFFRGVGEVLESDGGTLVVYGPFNHAGGYTRSEERRVWNEWVRPWKYRWSP